eukprot:NODE_5199_length_320_cov_316.420664_g4588_i0.p1 GENE.NODE_5199_length_320_cov_316.420664_g4588_i0~~NODE_5199_length_320_cov_316.420664_g4588_i0.p1  ORF type:complete len:87 (+),score=25.54 NODE_5199_length_320_cov_316.420664_g4588_i0:27-263(+)
MGEAENLFWAYSGNVAAAKRLDNECWRDEEDVLLTNYLDSGSRSALTELRKIHSREDIKNRACFLSCMGAYTGPFSIA